ncbi:MAG: hypothetical protein QW104_03560 [Nitrososphaerota archaeon]
MEFKIEARIPPRLFSKVSLVYSCIGLRYFHTGFIPSGLMHLGKWVWRFYPLTLVRLDKTQEQHEEVLFSFCFIYQSINGKRFFVTQPITFVDDIREGFEFFIENIEDFAKEACLNGVDIELHQVLDEYVSYPTSYTCISYDLSSISCNHDVFVEQLRSMGYKEYVKVWTYGIAPLDDDEQTVCLQDVSPESVSRMFIYENLFSYRSWTLPTLEHGLKPFGTPQIAKFASRDGLTEAAFILRPDLLEFAKKYRTPIPQLYQKTLGKYPFSNLKVVMWLAKDIDTLLASLKKLIHSETLKGFKRTEIAGVEDRLEEVKRALSGVGFRPACYTTILSKELV